jgi:hypothetical protein
MSLPLKVAFLVSLLSTPAGLSACRVEQPGACQRRFLFWEETGSNGSVESIALVTLTTLSQDCQLFYREVSRFLSFKCYDNLIPGNAFPDRAIKRLYSGFSGGSSCRTASFKKSFT